ncbi:MAG: endonuclease/exonuclease/phosphatase family protein [Polyangia bacterium]
MPAEGPAPAFDSGRARALTLNLWGEQGPLERRLQLVEQQLRALAPDVIALQEVRQIPGQLPNTAETLAGRLGLHHTFAPATEWGGGQEGLAILSRFPIEKAAHAELPHATPDERRILLWATLGTPHGPLVAATTHLNYRMTHGVQREDQVEAVDRLLREALAAMSPPPCTALLMGDFNATPDSDEIRFLCSLHSLKGRRVYYQDAYAVHSDRGRDPGYTWSRRNPYVQRLRFLQTDRRLDYIFVAQASRDGRGLVHHCRVALDEGDSDGVFPSDHFGVLAEVQLQPLP